MRSRDSLPVTMDDAVLSTLGVAAARLTWNEQGHSSRRARRRVADVPVSAATELNSLEAGAREKLKREICCNRENDVGDNTHTRACTRKRASRENLAERSVGSFSPLPLSPFILSE